MAKTLLIQRVHDTELEGYRLGEDYVEYRIFIDGKKIMSTGDYRTNGYHQCQGFAECFKYLNPDHSVVWETIEEEGLV